MPLPVKDLQPCATDTDNANVSLIKYTPLKQIEQRISENQI